MRTLSKLSMKSQAHWLSRQVTWEFFLQHVTVLWDYIFPSDIVPEKVKFRVSFGDSMNIQFPWWASFLNWGSHNVLRHVSLNQFQFASALSPAASRVLGVLRITVVEFWEFICYDKLNWKLKSIFHSKTRYVYKGCGSHCWLVQSN